MDIRWSQKLNIGTMAKIRGCNLRSSCIPAFITYTDVRAVSIGMSGFTGLHDGDTMGRVGFCKVL